MFLSINFLLAISQPIYKTHHTQLSKHISYQINKFGDHFLQLAENCTEEELKEAIYEIKHKTPSASIFLQLSIPFIYLENLGFSPYYADKKCTLWGLKNNTCPSAATATSAGVVIIKKGNQVLVIEEIMRKGEIDFPGGQCTEDELTEVAAQRETYEEVGLKVKSLKFIATQETPHLGKYGKTRFTNYFLAENFSGDIKLQKGEVLQAFWIDIKDIIEKETIKGLKIPAHYKIIFKGTFCNGEKNASGLFYNKKPSQYLEKIYVRS